MECKFCGKTVPSDSRFKNYCNQACYRRFNKDKLLEKNKIYRKNQRKKILATRAIYRNKNRKRINECQKRYYERNKESIIAKAKEDYYKNNNEKIREDIKKYKEKNKDKINKIKRRWWKNLPKEKRKNIIKRKADYDRKNRSIDLIKKEKDRRKKYRKNNPGKSREREFISRLKLKSDQLTPQIKKTLAYIRLGRRINCEGGCERISRDKVKEKLKAIEEGNTHEAYE